MVTAGSRWCRVASESPRSESNRRPPVYKTGALPIELLGRWWRAVPEWLGGTAVGGWYQRPVARSPPCRWWCARVESRPPAEGASSAPAHQGIEATDPRVPPESRAPPAPGARSTAGARRHRHGRRRHDRRRDLLGARRDHPAGRPPRLRVLRPRRCGRCRDGALLCRSGSSFRPLRGARPVPARGGAPAAGRHHQLVPGARLRARARGVRLHLRSLPRVGHRRRRAGRPDLGGRYPRLVPCRERPRRRGLEPHRGRHRGRQAVDPGDGRAGRDVGLVDASPRTADQRRDQRRLRGHRVDLRRLRGLRAAVLRLRRHRSARAQPAPGALPVGRHRHGRVRGRHARVPDAGERSADHRPTRGRLRRSGSRGVGSGGALPRGGRCAAGDVVGGQRHAVLHRPPRPRPDRCRRAAAGGGPDAATGSR